MNPLAPKSHSWDLFEPRSISSRVCSRVWAFNLTETEICLANIWGNGVLRAGNSVYKGSRIGHGKGTEKASVGHRARWDGAQSDLERRWGLEARVRTSIYPEGGGSPRALCCPTEGSAHSAASLRLYPTTWPTPSTLGGDSRAHGGLSPVSSC